MDRRTLLKTLMVVSLLPSSANAKGNSMGLSKFGFIVTGSNLKPDINRISMKSDTFEMIAVGVSEASEGVAVAVDMVAEGIQLIELCGGFGPVWTGRIIDAISGAVPVGSVGYGPESVDQMYRLFK